MTNGGLNGTPRNQQRKPISGWHVYCFFYGGVKRAEGHDMHMVKDGLHVLRDQTVAAGRYGRDELKRVLRRNFSFGLVISVCLHLCAIGVYYMAQWSGEGDESPTVKIRIMKYSDLGPPPSITTAPLPPVVNVAASVKPTVGVPVPVPDAEASPEQTLATQTELSSTPSPAMEEIGSGDGIQVEDGLTIEEDPGMDEFVPVERLPQVVKKVLPQYPELARKAGIEGTVWVKILVDKEGIPRKAVVIKSTAEILNDAATEAAMQFLFTPAVMNKGPVKVWVSIPFRFQLREAREPS